MLCAMFAVFGITNYAGEFMTVSECPVFLKQFIP